jgi:hypothetical protein
VLGAEQHGFHRCSQRFHRGFGRHGLALARELLQPLAEVDGVADQRVLQPLRGAEQGRRGHAGRQPKPEAEGGQAVGRPAGVDTGLELMHRRRGGHRAVRVVGLRERRAEHRHDRVPDELHHGPALTEDGVVHRGPVGVELPGELAGVGALGDRRI